MNSEDLIGAYSVFIKDISSVVTQMSSEDNVKVGRDTKPNDSDDI